MNYNEIFRKRTKELAYLPNKKIKLLMEETTEIVKLMSTYRKSLITYHL